MRTLLLLLAFAHCAFGQPFTFNDLPFLSQGTPPVPDTWTPSNRIADVGFWWRADRYTFSDNGTTPSVQGGPVQQWNSMDGDVNFALRDNGATHSPLYYTNIQNGLPAVFFNGAMWFRNVSDFNSPILGTIYIVAMPTNSNVAFVWSHADSADNDAQYFYFPASSDKLIFAEENGGAGNATTSTSISYSVATIGTGQRVSSSLRYAWNNGAGAGTNTTTVTFTGSFEGVYVGCYEGSQGFMRGFIFEIVGVTTVDDDAARLQMHNYLDRVWNVPGYP